MNWKESQAWFLKELKYTKEMRKMSVLPFIFSFFFYVQNRPKNCKIFHKNAYKTNIFCYNRRKSE